MRPSQFSQSVLITLAFMTILPYVMVTGLEWAGGYLLYPELLYHGLYLILLGTLVVAAVILLIDLKRPFFLVRKSLSGKKIDLNLIAPDCNALLKDFDLSEKPEGFLVDHSVAPFSYGVNRGRSMIAFPKNLL